MFHCSVAKDHTGASLTDVTNLHFTGRGNGVNIQPVLNTGLSRGNKLTHGERCNGEGTKVKVYEGGVAGNRSCVSSFTAFDKGTLVI